MAVELRAHAVIWALLGAYGAMVVLAPTITRRLGPRAMVVAGAPAAATTAWALTLGSRSETPTAELVWVEGLDLALVFRIDELARLLTLVVAGIGFLVFVYAAGYFRPDADGLGRFTATLVAFSGAMLGLVWADSVWTLFVFWEATSITSFLLVGHRTRDPAARRAARRALLITASGGLALLAGLLVLVDGTGTDRLSELEPVGGASATVAAVLVLIAAATKSAQVPFHVWLPGAMAAPTPVSAYLHSATMVKAGVVLMAVASPALAGTDIWTPLGLTLGGVSMIWGAVGALRQTDAKLVLAWGTISQLGLMVALLSLGTAKATFAAVALLTAHALFKATLFMVVGEIDVRTGTRDLTELSGLRRTMPLAFVVAVAAGASMAGAPPLLGFPAKEAAIEAVLGLDGIERVAATSVVVAGSVLTVAYTVRLLVGLFGPGPSPTVVGPPRRTMQLPAVALATAGLVGFFALDAITTIVRDAATEIDDGAARYDLLRWPGLTTAFSISMAVLLGGTAVGALLARRTGRAPRAVGAELADRLIDDVPAWSRRLTGRLQHGSLPVYVATMAITASLATIPFVAELDTDHLVSWHDPIEPVLAVVIVGAAGAAAAIGSRLGAALGLGAVGLGVSALFVSRGAPDLALTQLLVETVIVVGFVIGLGHLARRFPPVGAMWRGVRLTVATAVAVAVAIALVVTGGSPAPAPPVEELTRRAVDEGGGKNVVNVILTDIRALDTLGEVLVLAVVAVGVITLGRASRPQETT